MKLLFNFLDKKKQEGLIIYYNYNLTSFYIKSETSTHRLSDHESHHLDSNRFDKFYSDNSVRGRLKALKKWVKKFESGEL